MKHTIILTEGLEATPLAWLKQNAAVQEITYKDRPALAAALAQATGLIVRTYTRVDDALLALGPKLKVVGRAGVGLENIDQDACARRNIKVLSTPQANTHAVVEYVFHRPLLSRPGLDPDIRFEYSLIPRALPPPAVWLSSGYRTGPSARAMRR